MQKRLVNWFVFVFAAATPWLIEALLNLMLKKTGGFGATPALCFFPLAISVKSVLKLWRTAVASRNESYRDMCFYALFFLALVSCSLLVLSIGLNPSVGFSHAGSGVLLFVAVLVSFFTVAGASPVHLLND